MTATPAATKKVLQNLYRPKSLDAIMTEVEQEPPSTPAEIAAIDNLQANARAINHIAVSVADINAVTEWYTEVMGFHVHGGMIKHIKRSETPDASIFDIYGDSLNECKIAWMATGNGVGFEVFEFVDPKFEPAKTFEYNRGGFFHLCVTDSHPDALVEKVVKHGGKRIGKTIRNTLSRSVCLYCKDPWGNVLEILDMSFDQMAALDTCSPSELNARRSKL